MTGNDIVDRARGWIGTPYTHQQAARGAGCDCLGLLLGIWREMGHAAPEPVPAYSMDWAECSGREALWQAAQRHLVEKPLDAAAPGDVILFRMAPGAIAKHLGLQSEVGQNARFIHSYSGHGVVESPLSEPWARRIVARFELPGLTAGHGQE